jgi:hypothetical protein
LEWILKNRALWDFFYEHCSYYTKHSLTRAFENAGFQVEAVEHRFGGQYLWLEASLALYRNNLKNRFLTRKGLRILHSERVTIAERQGTSENVNSEVNLTLPKTDSSGCFGIQEKKNFFASLEPLICEYQAWEKQLYATWEHRILDLTKRGKIALWGAGAKGVTFANLFDPQKIHFDCIIDLNPVKQGCFLPGTGHPIVDFMELGTRNIQSVIVMNPIYSQENRALVAKHNIAVDFIIL